MLPNIYMLLLYSIHFQCITTYFDQNTIPFVSPYVILPSNVLSWALRLFNFVILFLLTPGISLVINALYC